MRLQDLIIDPICLGETLLLVEVKPVYEYKDNKRTDSIIAYKYVVALADKNLDKIGVKIEGKKLMETPEGYEEVKFDGLEIFAYSMNGKIEIGARAKGISIVNNK